MCFSIIIISSPSPLLHHLSSITTHYITYTLLSLEQVRAGLQDLNGHISAMRIMVSSPNIASVKKDYLNMYEAISISNVMRDHAFKSLSPRYIIITTSEIYCQTVLDLVIALLSLLFQHLGWGMAASFRSI